MGGHAGSTGVGESVLTACRHQELGLWCEERLCLKDAERNPEAVRVKRWRKMSYCEYVMSFELLNAMIIVIIITIMLILGQSRMCLCVN